MIPDNVTLIVKAPNQQIEDQNIQCQSSWTVKQLKGHLSEVYPSKPYRNAEIKVNLDVRRFWPSRCQVAHYKSTDEQKIIYSGQLLEDNIILKDVLRTYEAQLGHTMHLVCTPKRFVPEKKPTVTEPTPDGVRRRNVPENTPERPEVVTRPETRQNDQNHTVEMQNYLSSFVNNYGRVPPYRNNYDFGEYLPMANDPASMANHMMMMQQAYIQYMQQYANMFQAGGQPLPGTQPMNVVNEVPPQQPPAEAAAAPAEEAEDARRDWLDHIYAASRLAVLFSLVYLYSSPFRLLLVVMLAAAGYLHQVGFFRDLGVHQVNPVNANANANNDPPPRNEQPAENNAIPANEPVTHNANVIINDNDNQSLLAVTWMIFTSFFASLIPEMNQ